MAWQTGEPSVFGGATGSAFVGRTVELRTLHDLAGKVRAGTPQVVWVRGPAGIGKTSLVRQFLAGLSEISVLAATADPTETLVEYGVLDQLLRRLSRTARSSTPLLADRVRSDANPMAVGAQLLDLLGVLQHRGPVVLVVDDVQWADVNSVHALAFVLRRIWADQVLVLLATRPAEDLSSGQLIERLTRSCPDALTINLPGLPAADVLRLSRLLVGDRLPEPAVDRLRTYTGGHPLLLRMLLAELPAEQLADPKRRLTVPRSAVAAVRNGLERMPPSTRAMLDALAVLGVRSPLGRVAQVSGIAEPADAVQPALDSGFVVWWPDDPVCPVALAHDLQREAIYNALSAARRSELHARAATVVDQSSAWTHRVAACTNTDSGLADELEAAAAIEEAGGRHGVAAAYLRWAADLSPTRDDYERRLLSAGLQALFSTDRSPAVEVRDASDRLAESALRSLFLGMAALLHDGLWAVAVRHLTEAVRRCAKPGTPPWILGTASAGLAAAETWAGNYDQVITAATVAASTGGVPALLRDYNNVLLAVATSRRDGMVRGLAALDYVTANPAMAPDVHLDGLTCRGAIRTMLGRFDDSRRDLIEAVRRHRAGTFLIGGSTPYSYLAATHYQLGEWDEASVVMRQSLALSDVDEQPQNRSLRRMVASLVPSGRGDWVAATEHVRLAGEFAEQVGGLQDLRYAALAEATLLHAKGEVAGVLRALRRVPGLGGDSGTHRWWSLWWWPMLVEAQIHAGYTDPAAEELARLRAELDDSPYLAVTVVRLAALLADRRGDRAGALASVFDFLRHPARQRVPFAQAQLEHEHGRRLLGAGFAEDAVRWLTSAKAGFAALGAAPYEQRVDDDLARGGVSGDSGVGGPAVSVLTELTGREAEVVHLVERQLTNREIGAQLFVTVKTVEYHLGNIYAKLGVSTRRELRALLAVHRSTRAGCDSR